MDPWIPLPFPQSFVAGLSRCCIGLALPHPIHARDLGGGRRGRGDHPTRQAFFCSWAEGQQSTGTEPSGYAGPASPARGAPTTEDGQAHARPRVPDREG